MSGIGCSPRRAILLHFGSSGCGQKRRLDFRRRLLHFVRAWRLTAVMENRARGVAKRYSAFATRITKPTIARDARPAAKSWLIEACLDCWGRTGLAPWMNLRPLNDVKSITGCNHYGIAWPCCCLPHSSFVLLTNARNGLHMPRRRCVLQQE